MNIDSLELVGDNTNNILQPIIKWAGGKEKELKYIIPNLPIYDNYYEPFVGGGSVFAALKAKHYYINDLSSELISLYTNISSQNQAFFQYANEIDISWENAFKFFSLYCKEIKNLYINYRETKITKDNLKTDIINFCKIRKDEIVKIVSSILPFDKDIFLSEMEKNLYRKLTRMKELEMQKYILPAKDLNDNIETAIKSALYMAFREEYNRCRKEKLYNEYSCALFLFIRNYSYSGMFRYNDEGEFNVPYGGIAYNSKYMSKKLNYYKSEPLLHKLKDTSIYNLDFEDFFNISKPTKDDFVFLDPPYDSEFSTYSQNEFTRADQERLADYLINRCSSKWMMIIKYTDFIYSLYNKPNIFIKTFDKQYLVSFMNRNNKKTIHLLIANYQIN